MAFGGTIHVGHRETGKERLKTELKEMSEAREFGDIREEVERVGAI